MEGGGNGGGGRGVGDGGEVGWDAFGQAKVRAWGGGVCVWWVEQVHTVSMPVIVITDPSGASHVASLPNIAAKSVK